MITIKNDTEPGFVAALRNEPDSGDVNIFVNDVIVAYLTEREIRESPSGLKLGIIGGPTIRLKNVEAK